MSSRFGFTPARLLLLGVLAIAVGVGGCAKRYAGSLKDDAADAHAKPARAVHTSSREKAQPVAVSRPQPKSPQPAGPHAAQGTPEPCASSERCADELRAMLNDQSRSWIGKPQTVQEHLSGTRQFAYLALLQVMSCQELAAGVKDVQTSAQMRMPPASYSARILEQIKDLDTHVTGELQKEISARCPR